MCAEESLHGPSIVAYADTMIQGQISIAPDVDGIIWVKKVKDPSTYGVVSLDEKNNIIDLIEKPQKYVSDLAVVGIYYFKDISIIRDELKIHLINSAPYFRFLIIGIGLLLVMRYRPQGILPEKIVKQ